jgi:hypothetical protein
LTDIKQALIVRETAGAKIEHRLIDNMDQAARERVNGERIADLRAELALAVSEMQTVLTDGEPRQERGAAEDAVAREQAERARDEVIVEKNNALKTLADQRAELQPWQEAATELEPLVAAGRLAADIAREPQELRGPVDAMAQALVTPSSSETIPVPADEEDAGSAADAPDDSLEVPSDWDVSNPQGRSARDAPDDTLEVPSDWDAFNLQVRPAADAPADKPEDS